MLASSWCGGACLSDVDIPECVVDHSCSSAGDDAGPDGQAGADSPGQSVGGFPDKPGLGAGGESVPVGAGGAGASVSGQAGSASGESAGGWPNERKGECPDCVLLPTELVAPCAGKPYRVTLNVTGGVAPYQWQLTQNPGWTLAPDPEHAARAVLRADSVASGETTLTARVIDAEGLEKAITYVTRAREACWFAYTASGPEGPVLELLDPLTDAAEAAPLAHNTDVFDFRFSPDGRHLVYRYGRNDEHPHGRHLALVELSTLKEQALAFEEEAVTAYAWSPDSSVLAVGFQASEKGYLGGVRLPPSGSADSPAALTPTPAHVEDNLFWIGNEFVAYYAELQPDVANPGQFIPDNPNHLGTPFYAELGPAAFGVEQFTVDSFEPNAWLQPAHAGFWIINALTTFYPSDSSGESVLHYGASLVSPTGKYSATFDGTSLQLLPVSTGIFGSALSSRPDQACHMPLAWSQRDTVACVTDVDNGATAGSHGRVRLFGVEPGSDWLTSVTLGGFCEDDSAAYDPTSCTSRREGYGYGVSLATRAPRGFSASGRWFAFTRAIEEDAFLYWADLDVSSPDLTGSLFVGRSGSASRLAFSPDDRKLALQTGKRLFVKDLSGVRPEMLVSSQLAARDGCSEDFPTAPASYCGNTERDSSFKWATDSKALAYRTLESVSVVDTTHFGQIVQFVQSKPVCGEPLCSGDFEFQPH